MQDDNFDTIYENLSSYYWLILTRLFFAIIFLFYILLNAHIWHYSACMLAFFYVSHLWNGSTLRSR